MSKLSMDFEIDDVMDDAKSFVEEVAGLDKSVQRKKYYSEVEAIKQQHGCLEDMRSKLSLSRRKICEQLMVDPSAWTRWTQKDEESAPPHVYKTLALLIENRGIAIDGRVKPPVLFKPELEMGFAEMPAANLAPRSSEPGSEEQDGFSNEIRSQIEAMHLSLSKMKLQLEKTEVLAFGWKLLLLINLGLVAYLFFT